MVPLDYNGFGAPFTPNLYSLHKTWKYLCSCNASNSDKKYGGTHEDASVTVQGNKSKFNHPRVVKVMVKYHICVSSENKGDFGSNNGTFHHWHLVHCISI